MPVLIIVPTAMSTARTVMSLTRIIAVTNTMADGTIPSTLDPTVS
jgi:hypothetical protein